MFGLIKKKYIGLSTDLVIKSNHTNCVSLSNQKYMIQPTLINLNPNEYKNCKTTTFFMQCKCRFDRK